ncbi:MAG: hypothetical protein WA655_11075 [Candidatus Korobacteraceae bacterium]
MNTIITPSDFANKIIRLTDSNFDTTVPGASYDFATEGGPNRNWMDVSETRIAFDGAGAGGYFVSWNPRTMQATFLYGHYVNGAGMDTWASFVTPKLFYRVEFTGGNNTGNPAIYRYDTTSTVLPSRTLVKDLSQCDSSLSGTGNQGGQQNFNVSHDDQTFLAVLQNNSQQYLVVFWNRTNGCRVLNEATGVVTGAWGLAGNIIDTSTGLTPMFTNHGVILSADASWASVTPSTCIANCDPHSIYYWQVSGLTETPVLEGSAFGHDALGYSNRVNAVSYGCNDGTCFPDRLMWTEPFNDLNHHPATAVNETDAWLVGGSAVGWDAHLSWLHNDPTDSTPFCETLYLFYPNNPSPVCSFYDGSTFSPDTAWANEILCVERKSSCLATNSCTTWRFGHTFSSGQSPLFQSQIALGAVSTNGKWFMWTSDWDGMLGRNNGSPSCNVSSNCRSDLFITPLPTCISVSCLQQTEF